MTVYIRSSVEQQVENYHKKVCEGTAEPKLTITLDNQHRSQYDDVGDDAETRLIISDMAELHFKHLCDSHTLMCQFTSVDIDKNDNWTMTLGFALFKKEEEVLFTISADELVLEDLTQFEIDLFAGWIDEWMNSVYCCMCGEDMIPDEAYDNECSFFGREYFLCNLCNAYSGFHSDSDKRKKNSKA